MASVDETIILEIKISEEEVEKKILASRAALVQLNKAMADLRKEYKSGQISAHEFAQSEQAIKTQMASASTAIREGTKTLSDYAKSQKAAQGSIDQMRAQLPLLSQQYTALSKAQRNAAEGQDLQKQIKSLSDELKGNESAIGSNQRNVGNYIKDLNIMGVRIGDVTDGLEKGKGAWDATTTAVKGVGGGLKLLMAIPIILLLTGLVAFLKSTDEGADKLEQTISFLTGAFESLAKGIAPIGKLLYDAFFNRDEFIKKLKEGTDEYNVSLSQVATNALNAGEAHRQYTKAMQDLEDRQDGLIGVTAKVNEQVQLAILAARDRSRSEKERLSLLDAAGNAERKLSKETVAIKKAEYDELKKLQSKKTKLDDEDRKASRQAYADYVNARSASSQTEQTIQNRRSALREQEEAENKKSVDKAKENARMRAQALVDEAEGALIMAKRKGEDTIAIEQELLKRQLNLINARAAAEKAGVDKGIGYAAKVKLIEQKAISERIEAAQAAAAKIAEIVYTAKQTQIETELAFARRGSEEELDLRVRAINAQRNRELSEARRTIKDKQKLFEEEERINLTAARASGDARMAFEQSEANRRATLAQARLQTEFDLSKQTLADEQELAANRIDLEEATQKELLEIEKTYGQITDDDYLTRLNAIQAKALASHKQLTTQIKIDAIVKHEEELTDRLIRVRAGSKEEFKIRQQQLEDERKKALANAKDVAEEIAKINRRYDDKQAELQEDRNKQQLDKVVQVASQATAALSTMVDAQVAAQTNQLDQQYQGLLSSAALSSEARTKIEAEYEKKKEKIAREANEKRKKIATAQNFINVALGVTKAFADLGPIGGAIASLFILAQGAAQQAVIDNQKFARGGIVDGPSHAQGGVKYRVGNRTIELEGGEVVINKRSSAKHIQTLSRINSENNWGRPFAATGPVIKPRFDVSHAVPKFQYGGTIPTQDNATLAAALKVALKDLKVYTAITDIRKADKNMTRVEAGGNI